MKSIPFILLVVGCLGLVGLSSFRQDPPSSGREQAVPQVETVAVRRCENGFSISVDGEVVPFREISLAAEVRGRIVEKPSRSNAGNYVRKGELLFRVDPRDYQLTVRRLQETLQEAGLSIEKSDVEKSNLEGLIASAEEKLQLQRAEMTRFKALREKGAASDSQLEGIRRTELEVLDALQELNNRITSIKADRNLLAQQRDRAVTGLEQANLDLDRTTVTSPIDGVIIQDFAEEDDFVQPGSQLVQIEDTSKVEVRFSMRMEKLRWLWAASEPTTALTAPQYSYKLPQLAVRVRAEIDGFRFYWPARLDRYDGAGINAATRTVPVIAVVDDPTAVQLLSKDEDAPPLPGPPTLLRGSYVTVEIPVGKSLELVAIPPSALRPGGRVWAFRDGKLNIEQVKVAHASDEQVVLLANPNRLRPGDEVITSPLPLVVDQMPLERWQPARVGTKDAAMASSEQLNSEAL